MKSNVLLQIAKTHLTSRLKQTIVAALGVTFGISMFIAMISFMTGVNKFMDDMMLDNTAHIHLYNDLKPATQTVLSTQMNSDEWALVHNQKPKNVRRNIRNSIQMVKLLRKNPDVIGVSPNLQTQVFYQYGTNEINGTIVGVEILEEEKLFRVSTHMKEGEISDLLTVNNGILMGSGLAKKMSIGVHDKVTVTSPTGGQFQLAVVGIFKTGLQMIDETQSYASLKTAQRLLGKKNDYITDINLKLYKIEKAPSLAKELANQFDIKAVDIETANAQFEVGNSMRNFITYAVVIALLTVAGFGIYNILTMMIYEKMSDIAILKATGFSGRDIRRIFIAEAMIIGFFGGLLGLGLGFLMAYGIASIPYESDVMITMTKMPVSFELGFYVFGMVFALVTTFFAGFLPARKASKLDPVSIIRGK